MFKTNGIGSICNHPNIDPSKELSQSVVESLNKNTHCFRAKGLKEKPKPVVNPESITKKKFNRNEASRERNRICSQRSRDKVKKRIADLEKRVEQLYERIERGKNRNEFAKFLIKINLGCETPLELRSDSEDVADKPHQDICSTTPDSVNTSNGVRHGSSSDRDVRGV